MQLCHKFKCVIGREENFFSALSFEQFNYRKHNLMKEGRNRYRKLKSASYKNIDLVALFALSMTCSLLAGCKEDLNLNQDQDNSAPTSAHPSSNQKVPIWKETSIHGKWFQVQLKTLDNESILQKEAALARYSIREDEANNYRSYQIEGRTEKGRFIIPKLLVRSEVFGGRVRTDTYNGITSVQFPIALIDGTQSKVTTGYSELTLPKAYIDQPLEQNKANLVAQSGTDCPDLIELRQGDESLSLSLSFSEGGCARNQFFLVNASGPTAEIRTWFEEKIPRGNVTIQAAFRPTASFTKEVVNIEINSSLLFERLYAYLIESRGNETTSTLESQIFGIGALHDQLKLFFDQSWKEAKFTALHDSELNTILDSVIDKFFERSERSCPVYPKICLRLKSKADPKFSTLQFIFNRNQIVPIHGNPIEVSAPLYDLSQDVELVQIEGEKSDDTFAPTQGRLGGSMRQLSPGDLVELEISEIQTYRREYSQAMFREDKSKLNNPICASWGAVPSIEITDPSNCLEYNQECNQRVTCDVWADPCVEWEAHCCRSVSHGGDYCTTIRRGDLNWPNTYQCYAERCVRTTHVCSAPVNRCVSWINTSCRRYGTKRVPNGSAPCERIENQWMKYFDLADPLPMKLTREDLSLIDPTSVVSGLKLEFTSFTWDINNLPNFVKTTCALSNFLPEVKIVQNKILIRFRVENHPESLCSPFNAENTVSGFEPEVSLVNQLAISEKMPCGFRRDFWNGKIIYTCPELNQSSDQIIYQTYFPRMDIAGRMRLLGVRFVSQKDGSLK